MSDQAEIERLRAVVAAQREALRWGRALRPFKAKALGAQYLVCINEGDWNRFVVALAALDAEGVSEPGEGADTSQAGGDDFTKRRPGSLTSPVDTARRGRSVSDFYQHPEMGAKP